jgi:threonine/homoserine efflux transporter RhtA
LVLLGVCFTALPHTLRHAQPAAPQGEQCGIIATLLPIYGALGAALLLGEVPALRTAVGGGVILAAIAVETWRVVRR